MENHQSTMEKSNKLTVFLACGFIVFVFFLFLNQNRLVNPKIHTPSNTINYEEKNWILQQGNSVINSRINHSCFITLEPDTVYTMKTVLSYDGAKDESPYVFFHVNHMFCRVLLDGKELFSFMPEDVGRPDHSKSPGFIYKSIPLPHDCRGKEMEIQLLPPFHATTEYKLPDLFFGDYTSTIRESFGRDTLQNLIIFLFAVIGIISIFFSAFTLHGTESREGISIGIFCILFSSYMVTECRTDAFYIGNPYLIYLINYISLALLPVSLTGFMRERLPEKFRKFWNVMIAASLLFFCVLTGLHFSGICDLRESVSLIHILSLCDVFLMIMLMMTMQNSKRKRALLLQAVPLVCCMFLDITIYHFHWAVGASDATFTIIGVLLFLIIEIVYFRETVITIYENSIHSKIYREMAYVDELTQAGNRRAYDEEISNIISGDRTYQSMVVMSVDVNRLKAANDSFGHAAGDCLIAGAAKIILSVIGKSGLLFRTGGDEFSVFLYDVNEQQYMEMDRAIQEGITAFNKSHPYQLSLAFGYVRISDHEILRAAREADQKMYEDKVNKRAVRK